MPDFFQLPRIPAKLSFNGGPTIEGTITDFKIGADDMAQLQDALAAQMREQLHDLELKALTAKSMRVVVEFPTNLTFEHIAMLQARSRDSSGLNRCVGITCNSVAYQGLTKGMEDLGGPIFCCNAGGTFLFGIELFEVRTQEESALVWYDEKAMREYLEANR